jgi:GH18 family chitinase
VFAGTELRRILAGALLAVCLCHGAAADAPAHGRIVGYATGWDPAHDRDAAKIDTLIFAFAHLTEGRVLLDGAGKEHLLELTALKATHPALRVAISVAAGAPWLWNAQTRRFISYDDPQSIAAKAAYVRAQRLGGLMYWEQSLDPRGELLEAMWQGLHR